ncbi:MAG: DUF2085 domain-containing protein [Oscillospiraceae bacterium]|nr:DUF2085 domain-containing protein [Oscillospiraceae bacterium]
MRLGCRAGCHQRPDRSFFFKGYQFPVCARCTGVLIGYLVAIPSYIAWGVNLRICIIFAAIMFLDWVLQYGKLLESTNIRRLATGVCGGYSIMSVQMFLLHHIVKFVFWILI